MKAIDLIRNSLQFTEQGMLNLIEDMRDAPFTQPTAVGGNHPLWVMGHLACIEGFILAALLGDEPPSEHWASMFAPGTQPRADGAGYPPFDEVVRVWRDVRARTLRRLAEVGEAGLDAPSKAPPPGFEEALKTVGQGFMLIVIHQMVHYGQVTDARRMAGRMPLM
jgi:hypothetical protein